MSSKEHERGMLLARVTAKELKLKEAAELLGRRSRPKARRRERREHFGELVQMDGSFHDWVEGRGERTGRRSCVMNMVDDATGCTLLRFGSGVLLSGLMLGGPPAPPDQVCGCNPNQCCGCEIVETDRECEICQHNPDGDWYEGTHIYTCDCAGTALDGDVESYAGCGFC